MSASAVIMPTSVTPEGSGVSQEQLETIAEVLGFMQRKIACPDDVRARIAALRVPADEFAGPRVAWRGPSGSGERSGYPAGERPPTGQRSGYSESPRNGAGFHKGGERPPSGQRSGYHGGERSGYHGGGGAFHKGGSSGGSFHKGGERSGYPTGERSGYHGGGERSGCQGESERPQQTRGWFNKPTPAASGPRNLLRPLAGSEMAAQGLRSEHRGSDPLHLEGGAGEAPSPPPNTYRPPSTPYTSRPPRMGAPRFGNRARQDASTEERMMDRIRDKMNKFSSLTYDATKTWLSQLLDSGETEFLSGFITLVFEKAANEPAFCSLYARLITELREAFPHLNVELLRIFTEFLSIFEDVVVEPTEGTSEYDAFVALRERRRGRRGYASFIAEVATKGVIPVADVTKTCSVILDSLNTAKQREEQQLLCEEYADCLMTIMKGGKAILTPTVGELIPKVRVAMDRTGAKSLTNRARFSLMDVIEMYSA